MRQLLTGLLFGVARVRVGGMCAKNRLHLTGTGCVSRM